MANNWKQDFNDVFRDGGSISCIYDAGGGTFYVGGSFDAIGGVKTRSIAKWDGSAWSALGSSFANGCEINTIQLLGSDLYVGGNMGGYGLSSNLAKYNGTVWSAVGAVGAGPVYALKTVGSDIYMGGAFWFNGGSAVHNYFTKLVGGTAFTSVGTFPNAVTCISALGTDVYVGGGFTSINGSTAISRFAKWNGATWSAVGNPGFDFNVSALKTVSATEIYAGGGFSTPANRITKWNGSQWVALGSGLGTALYTHVVNAIEVVGANLYVGGNFVQAGGSTANSIARWNGTQWSPVSGGANNRVSALTLMGSELYVGGSYTLLGGTLSASGLSKYTSEWVALDKAYNMGFVHCIKDIGSGVYYVGGAFSRIGSFFNANCIAKWNGSAWESLGSGLLGTSSYVSVRSIAVDGSNVYTGGNFDFAGGSTAAHVAHWDGTKWNPMSTGFGPFYTQVSAVEMYNGIVHVGGDFSQTGTGSAVSSGLQKWDGTAWSRVGTVNVNNVLCLTPIGSELYIGGNTYVAGRTGIAKWNGTQFSSVADGNFGGGTGGVQVIEQVGSDILVGGDFTYGGSYSSQLNVPYLLKLAGGTSWQVPQGGLTPVKEIANFTCVADSNFSLNDKYFTFAFFEASQVMVYSYYVWYLSMDIDAPMANDPMAGSSGIQVYYSKNDTADTIAANTRSAISGAISMAMLTGASVSGTGTGVTLTYDVGGGSSDPTTGNSGFSLTIAQQGVEGQPITDQGVYAIKADGTNVYIGGYFYTLAGSVAANAFGRWNGSNWEAVGGSFDAGDYVYAIEKVDSNILVGGTFRQAGGSVPAIGFAMWEGPDLAAPTVGNSGTITKTNITGTSLDLNWTKATDSVSSQANLQYLAYYSLNSSMSSVSDIETYGTAVGSYTADINTKPVSGLTAGNTYYFNVIVKDEAGNKAAYAQVSHTMDGTAPDVGNSGIITTSGVGQTGVTLNWTKATDNVSSQANLQYLAYYSTSSSFDTIGQVESGTAIGTYTADINTKPVTGLSAGTTYYFNVIVKDEIGNKAVYAKKMQATNAAETTVIDGDNSSVGDGETATWGSIAGGLTLTVNGEVISGGEVVLQIASLDDLTGIAYFIEVKPGASLTFSGETIIPKSGTIYRLRPRT